MTKLCAPLGNFLRTPLDSLVLLFTKYKRTWLTAISISLSRCITCQDVCLQQSQATKRLPS